MREHNEDTIASTTTSGSVVLADGMGGYNAGEVASGIAVKTIVNLVREGIRARGPRRHRRADRPAPPEHHPARRHHRANKIIYQTAKTQAAVRGHGHDRRGGLFYDNRISIAHVGDSRMYRAARRASFEQVTMDHSLLQELVDRGFYSPEEAQRAANKNYVTRALGVEPRSRSKSQE